MKALILAVALVLPVPVSAQSAAIPSPEAPVVSIPVCTRVGSVPSGYEDGGRRDPFSSLVAPKRTSGQATADGRPRSGLAALALSDAVVKGIVKNGTTMLAILEAPGRQSFVARVKDWLLDASVQSIDSAGVVFAGNVGAGTPTQVRKGLRPTGEEVR